MAGKWAHLKGKVPERPLQGGSEYLTKLREDMDDARRKTKQELAEQELDLTEQIAVHELNLKNAQRRQKAARIVLTEKMENEGVDSMRAVGYTWTPSVEPYPNIEDKAAYQAWARKHMPDTMTVPHQTTKATVKQCLENDEPLPDGVGLYLEATFSRRKAGK